MAYNKYYVYKRQVSTDNGLTWADVYPAETKPYGESIATYETLEECEGLLNVKLKAFYSDGSEHTVSCDSESPSTLTSGDVRNDESTHYRHYTAMTDAIIGSCVSSIGYTAFDHCTSLTSVTFGRNVTSIDVNAFADCHELSRVNSNSEGVFKIPNTVTYIGASAFFYCKKLKSINIPNGIAKINDYTFQGCSGLTTITIPNSVTSIGTYAFGGCTGLTSITCLATTPPTLGTNVFYNTSNCPIYVPAASVSAYQTAWSDYASRIQAIP